MCKIFDGKYQPKMRLVYGFDQSNYSNEFYGQMNYGQFNEEKY